MYAALQARNRDVWDDLEDIIPSVHWMEEIHTGITGGSQLPPFRPGDGYLSPVG